MFNFFKKKPLPEFPVLAAYVNKDKYFVRVASWMDTETSFGNIVVVDPHGPRVITFDPWPETVFLNAMGDRTVKQYIEDTARSYSGKVPNDLDDVIVFELEKLVNEYKIVEWSDIPRPPAPEHNKPKRP